ncbi:hypothetical protein GCM10010300_47930 [Streptomyces olivaceoviridis]|nr:hypothetical protein GCM10010300_47930 [Streptomyces olivaceoviridis]
MNGKGGEGRRESDRRDQQEGKGHLGSGTVGNGSAGAWGTGPEPMFPPVSKSPRQTAPVALRGRCRDTAGRRFHGGSYEGSNLMSAGDSLAILTVFMAPSCHNVRNGFRYADSNVRHPKV